ncbi:hypothetical protein ACQ4N7_01125 [Nodosilinea sp. AN01ver1]|uniref:hypothetical protein n=1 Tax=Nodosilinea sp. AN01ver1 TaxID=3423362 RepID=UPI003D322EF4
MKTTHVEFSALFNLGDYSNEKIGFRVQLEEGDDIAQVVEHLRDKAVSLSAGEGQAREFYNRLYSNQRELRELERKIAEATDQWNQVAQFLRTQGINPQAPNLPSLPALTPGQPDEADAELVF